MPKLCPTCGEPLQAENAEICPGCGVRIQPPPVTRELRSPLLAAILSFFFVGWGQWYNGKTYEGLKFIGAFYGSYIFLAFLLYLATTDMPFIVLFAIFFFIIPLAIWIYGMYDAYKGAEKINNGEEIFSGKSVLFWLPVVLLGIVLILTLSAIFLVLSLH
ncbi:MAG: hypothetical protein METHP_02147 [Methanoregula sp. SKADARSKE-2]|nr:MAG: hypothetical protein METHP_02147 [Methanoregula sp. SKADARSKE-2]